MKRSRTPGALLLCLAGAAAAVVATAATPPPSPPALQLASPAELRRVIADTDAAVVVVNVWATWCVPCREEFPALLRLRETYRPRGVSLLLVSGDFPSHRKEAVAFLAAAGVTFPTYIKTGKDMELIDTLHPEWSGALPATFLYDDAGALLEWWEGAADYDRFAAAVERALAGGGKEEKP